MFRSGQPDEVMLMHVPALRVSLGHYPLEWVHNCLEGSAREESSVVFSKAGYFFRKLTRFYVTLQVREKLYSTAVGKWKKYGKELKDVQKMLVHLIEEYEGEAGLVPGTGHDEL